MFPKVSLIMPVYNGEKYVSLAIDSILAQSFDDFEFLIFDDGSSDSTATILNNYHDDRIKLFHSDNTEGYTYHLNNGLKISTGKYIARMDADDISHPERLKNQVEFLDQNLEYGLVGSWATSLPSNALILMPIEDEDIRISMLRINGFIHPSVMFRKIIVETKSLNYIETLMPAEDYFFFYQLSNFCKVKNIPQPLLSYRKHVGQISYTRKIDQLNRVEQIRRIIITEQFGEFSVDEFKIYNDFINRQLSMIPENINKLSILLLALVNINTFRNSFDQTKLSIFLSHQWNEVFINSLSYNMNLWKEHRKIKLPAKKDLSFNQSIRFLIKCLIKYKKTSSKTQI